MNHCETCTHWKFLWEELGIRMGSCWQLTEAADGCKCRVYPDSWPITTESQFGCIHHVAKTTEARTPTAQS